MRGVGVAVVSELDARNYKTRLEYRPFVPSIPHQLSLVRPIHKMPSKITLDFLELFEKSLSHLLVDVRS